MMNLTMISIFKFYLHRNTVYMQFTALINLLLPIFLKELVLLPFLKTTF